MGHTESEMAWVKAEKCYYVFDGDIWKPLTPKPVSTHTISMSDVNTEIEILVHDMDELESKLTISVDNVVREQNQRFIDQHKTNDNVEESFSALAGTLNQHSTDLDMTKHDLLLIDQTLNNHGSAMAHAQRINSELKKTIETTLQEFVVNNDKLIKMSNKVDKFSSDIEALLNKKPETRLLWLAISSVALIEIIKIIVSIT